MTALFPAKTGFLGRRDARARGTPQIVATMRRALNAMLTVLGFLLVIAKIATFHIWMWMPRVQ